MSLRINIRIIVTKIMTLRCFYIHTIDCQIIQWDLKTRMNITLVFHGGNQSQKAKGLVQGHITDR